MPKRKGKVKNKNRLLKELEEQPANNNKNDKEINDFWDENKIIEKQKEKTTDENEEIGEQKILNEEALKIKNNSNIIESGNILKDYKIKENKIILRGGNVNDEFTNKNREIGKDLLLNNNEILYENQLNEKNNSNNPKIINSNEIEKKISITNDSNKKDEIKLNERQNSEEKINILKIANIEYERFIKENEKLFRYIKKVNVPIKIKNVLFKEKDIKLKNYSLLKIIKQSCLENDFKIYLTTQIITETIQFETSSNKNITYNKKIEKFIKNIFYLNIYYPKKINNILLKKESFIKIFTLIGLNYYKDIYNYLQFTITQIYYEFNKTKKIYVLKGVKSLKKLMEKKKIFYTYKYNRSIYDELIPLSNYSIQKIFKLFNGGKDTKYLLLNYEIKNMDFINYEKRKQKYLDILINISDVKNMLIKYNIGLKKDPQIVINQEKLKTFEKLDIFDLDIYLKKAEEKLINIDNKIHNKKNNILKITEEPNNQFIEVLDSNGNIRFINKQYIKLIKDENDEMNHNIYSYDFYDYNSERITVMKKSLEGISKEEKTYIEIKIKDKNYLINKNKLLKICDSWKILYQEDTIDAYDTKKISKEIKEKDKEKINILLIDIIIVVQDIINEIKINENKDYNIKESNYGNNIITEKYENNLIIIEEEENNIQDENNKLRDREIDDEKEKRKMKMLDYLNSLPPKNNYYIKYKVKTERIPKKK